MSRAPTRQGLALLLALLLPAWVSANTPVEVVEKLQDALLAVMKDAGRLGYSGRYQRLEPVIRDSFDLPFIVRLAVGRYWQDLSEAQQAQLVDTFTRLSVSTYAAQFDGYGGETFRVESRQALADGDVVVRAVLHDPDGDRTFFDYQLHRNGGDWRIVNIIVDGISDLALKRAQYTATLRRQGFDALLARLAEKAASNAQTAAP
ncbi:MAG: ABC transporter substrate-binding protein [Pseudomonadota bacterium]|nr:ABC transporter substrate-binding protein [Pseudomonadota bacterium]